MADFLSYGSEMGKLIREFDWARTPLGPIENWPQSLKTSVSLMISSQQPIWMSWGTTSENSFLYNDAYVGVLSHAKHPSALGKPAHEVWAEIWDFCGPLSDQVYNEGKASFVNDIHFFMRREGFLEEVFYSFSYTPIYEEEGKVGGLFCANIETTDKILSERRLKTLSELSTRGLTQKTIRDAFGVSAEILSKNTEDVPFALIYLLDADCTIARLEQVVGLSKHEKAVAPSEIELTDQLKETSIWPLIEAARSGNRRVINVGHMTALPLGQASQTIKQAIVLPLTPHGNNTAAAILIAGINPTRKLDNDYSTFYDLLASQIVTAIQNANAAEEEKKRLEIMAELDRAKTIFFSNISHEFRTPLTLMLSPLEEVLSDGELLSGKSRSNIEVSYRNTLRLQKLVNSLLDFSRIEAGRMKTAVEHVNISNLTNDLASSFRPAIEKAGIEFVISCDEACGNAYVDISMWENIVLNLISNALKYTSSGRIDVSLKKTGNQIELVVKDTGIGIGLKDQKKIFERFYRIENGHGRTQEGTGIGLSMVQELVRLHDGTIQVESTIGKGSTFKVKIPVGTPPTLAHENGTESSDAKSARNFFVDEALNWIADAPGHKVFTEFTGDSRSDKFNIVLADDNSDMRAYILRLLKRQYEVRSARDGEEACDLIADHAPDLIISDIMMPRLDGLGLLKRVRQNPATRQIPFLFLSARAGEEAKVDGIEAGADDYLTKPFSARELIAKVGSSINISQERKKNEAQLRSFLMQAPAAIAIVSGAEKIYTLANPLYQKLFGRSEQQLIGRSIREVFPEIEGQGIYELFDNVYASGEPFTANDYPANFSDEGQTKAGYFNFVTHPIKEKDGRVTDIMVHAVDVTAQVTARKQIEESEAQFKGVLLQSPSIFLILKGQDMVITFANEPLLLSWGRTMDIVGKPLLEALPEIKDQPFPKLLENVYRTGESQFGKEEKAVLIKNGIAEDVYYNYAYQPIFDSANSVSGITVMASDVTEQVVSRKKIEENERALKEMANAMPQLVWVANHDGAITFYNERISEYQGAEKADDGNWAWKGLLHPDEVEATSSAWKSAIEKGTLYTRENRIRTPDGQYKWHLTRAVPQKDADGNILKWFGTATDIHEQKMVEEDLQYTVSLIENIADALIITDRDYKIRTWNKAAEQLYGWTFAEVLGKPAGKFIPTTFINPADKQEWELALLKKGHWQGEVIQTSKDGTSLSILASIANIKDKSGSPIGATAVNRDISDRKKYLHELKIAKEQLELTFQNIPASIYLFDSKGRIIYLNDNAARLIGYENPADLIDGSLSFVHKEMNQQFVLLDERGNTLSSSNTPTSQVLQTHTTSTAVLQYKSLRDGSIKWLQTTATPLFNSDGIFSMVLTTTADVTLQKQLNLELEARVQARTSELSDAIMKLERSNVDLQQFAHVTSHDLKEPVRKIKMYSNLLKTNHQSALVGKGEIYLDKIEHATRRITAMIDGVLQYSSIDAYEQGFETIDLNAICDSIREDQEILINQTHTRFIIGPLPMIEGSPILMYQLFYNLINNSLKFTRPGVEPLIRINANSQSKGEFVQIDFQDNGIGFNQAYAEKIFESFTRLHSKDKFEGTGLGLALCKKIVERHGGSIKASGEEGKGATFSILLPLISTKT